MTYAPTVSIIIPAHNEAKTIGIVLQGCLHQDYPSDLMEIIVVDDCSNDDTPKVVQQYSRIIYVRNERNLGLAASLNKGIMASRGEIVVTLHADCLPLSEDWLKSLISHFSCGGVGAVSSFLLLERNRLNYIDRSFCHIYVSGWPLEKFGDHDGSCEISFVSNKCDAYRKEILEQVGFFDTQFKVANEDIDLSEKIKRRGYKIILDRRAKVLHLLSYHQRGLKKHFAKAIQYGRPQMIIRRRYGYVVNPCPMISVALIPLVAIAFLGSLFLQSYLLLVSEYSIFAFLSIILLRKRMPDFYVSSKRYMKLRSPLMATLLALPLMVYTYLTWGSSLTTIVAPLLFPLGFLLGRACQRSLNSLRDYRDFLVAMLVVPFSLIWDALYGLSSLAGFARLKKAYAQ
ncbi:MAG: glycosyltransferase [archaeon]|nr:glycosyltransferase [archaeon]MCP8314425.1 glycosyltransferase [archaeon]MCP8319369.1 glycosyltransferase [archaeon]